MNVQDIIEQGTEKIKEVLTPENVKKYKLSNDAIKELIESSGEIEKYLIPGLLDSQYIGYVEKIIYLIEKSGNKGLYEKILTFEMVEAYQFRSSDVEKLIIASGKIDEYIQQPELLNQIGLTSFDVSNLIKEKIKNLPKEEKEKYYFEGQGEYTTLTFANLVMVQGAKKISEFLDDYESIEKYHMRKDDIIRLVMKSKNPEIYFEGERKERLGIKASDILTITKNRNLYEIVLTPDNVRKYGLGNEAIKELIEASKETEKYLIPGLFDSRYIGYVEKIIYLIEKSGNKGLYEKILTFEMVEAYQFRSSDVEKLIIASGKIDEYIQQPDLLNKMGLNRSYVSDLINEKIKNLPKEEKEKYYFEGQDENSYLTVANLVMVQGEEKISEFLDDYESIEKYNVRNDDIIRLIMISKNPEIYFEGERRERLGIKSSDIILITKKRNLYKKVLTPENVKKYKLNNQYIEYLIEDSGDIEEFLKPGLLDSRYMGYEGIFIYLIEKSGNNGLYEKILNPEMIEAYQFRSSDVKKLIIASGKIDEYFEQPELLNKMRLRSYDLSDLIREKLQYLSAKEQRQYLFEGQNIKSSLNMSNIIKAMGTEKIIEYLNPELLLKFNIANDTDITNLIKSTEKVDEFLFEGQNINDEKLTFTMANVIKHLGRDEILNYITPENLYRFKINDNKNISNLINATNTPVMFLFEGEELIPNYQFSMANIIKGLNLCPLLNKEQVSTLCEFDDIEIMRVIFSLDVSKQKDGIHILTELSKSNSAELRRIKNEVAMQILEKEPEEYDETLKRIENIYLTSNVPNAAKRFMVFRELHPNFLDEDARKKDASIGNIPSLKEATGKERSHIIFSDLLRCALESNSRNLRDYLNVIERGNALYEKIVNDNEEIKNFDKADLEILIKYRDILNTLYNESSYGRRLKEKRNIKDNLEVDLRELDILFEKSNPYLKNMNLADRVVKTFGYWAGVNSLAEAKQMMLEAKNKAEERNKKVQEFVELKEGDFVKGIADTKYFASMLQNGIVAKDYLGGNADHDGTPLDADVQKVLEQKETFSETLNQLTIAKSFTNSSVDGKNLGTIMLVFDGEDFIETRDEHGKVITKNIEELKENKDKKEVFCNGGFAYGIRTGIGSTNIKYIIADRYVDKLGLEIALNGFYIPIVDKTGKVIFTREMYNEISSKMQGLSYYNESEFVLDETAKNSGTEKIAQLVDRNLKDSESRRNKVLEIINDAIEKCGYKMSKSRRLDLVPGLIEIIDTGSTGRGTNEPGDGDFDFMVRLDKLLSDKPENFKQALREELGRLGIREKTETGTGDFRYKGVKIEGLEKEIDVDLSFTERTNEIEYSTDESIKDRLNTMKEQDINTYKIVIANILLAKKMLKKAGAYKKKDGPAPEQGQADTRGGLGAVGIENWILQNGGSFYKASKSFLDIAQECKTLSEFQQQYEIWDFGENHISTSKNIYPHDNFVYNLNENGFKIMKEVLAKYIEVIDKENLKSNKKSLSDLVAEDTEILADSPYMQAVYALLDKEKLLLEEGRIDS